MIWFIHDCTAHARKVVEESEQLKCICSTAYTRYISGGITGFPWQRCLNGDATAQTDRES